VEIPGIWAIFLQKLMTGGAVDESGIFSNLALDNPSWILSHSDRRDGTPTVRRAKVMATGPTLTGEKDVVEQKPSSLG